MEEYDKSEYLTIPIEISRDMVIALNESEQELKAHFQSAVAIMLWQEQKITFGKAVQLSGLTRYEFEKQLVKSKISISDLDHDQIMSDVKKLKNA